MFVVLDTNHFAELVHDTGAGTKLKHRLTQRKAQVLTTVITAQEVSEGWSAFIRKQKAGSDKQVHGYAQFQHSLEMLMELTMLSFDDSAAGDLPHIAPSFTPGGNPGPENSRHLPRP